MPYFDFPRKWLLVTGMPVSARWHLLLLFTNCDVLMSTIELAIKTVIKHNNYLSVGAAAGGGVAVAPSSSA